MTSISAWVAPWDEDKVLSQKTNRPTIAGVAQALKAHPRLEFRTPRGYLTIREALVCEIDSIEVRWGHNLLTVITIEGWTDDRNGINLRVGAHRMMIPA